MNKGSAGRAVLNVKNLESSWAKLLMDKGKSNVVTSRMSSAKSSLAQLTSNMVKSIRAVLCGGVEEPNDKKSRGSIKESMEASLGTNEEKPKCPML